MNSQTFITVKIFFGGLFVLSGLALIIYGALKQRKYAVTSVTMMALGAWLIAGGKIEVPHVLKADGESLAEVDRVLNSNANPDAVFARYQEGVRIWWVLLQYRIELRSTLRSVCIDHGAKFDRPDTSFSELLEFAQNAGLLRADLSSKLAKIRENTYWAEWREGRIPDTEAIQYVIDNAPEALKELESNRKGGALGIGYL